VKFDARKNGCSWVMSTAEWISRTVVLGKIISPSLFKAATLNGDRSSIGFCMESLIRSK